MQNNAIGTTQKYQGVRARTFAPPSIVVMPPDTPLLSAPESDAATGREKRARKRSNWNVRFWKPDAPHRRVARPVGDIYAGKGVVAKGENEIILATCVCVCLEADNPENRMAEKKGFRRALAYTLVCFYLFYIL